MSRRSCHITIIALMALAAVVPPAAQAQRERPDYRGQIFYEIKIDDRGIILTDSAGNETMIPAGASDEYGDLPGIPAPPLPLGEDFNPDDYKVQITSIRKVGSSVTVEEDEHVMGEVVAIGGNITIKGLVDGSVTTTGTVRVTRTGIVLGNVIGKVVIEEPGARVLGQVTEQPMAEIPWPRVYQSNQSSDAAIGAIVYFMMLFVFTFGVAMLFRKPTDRIKTLYSQNILKTLAVGFLAWILLLPVFILLCITIIGLPVAILGMPLAMIGAGLLGGAAFSLFIADFVRPKDAAREEGRFRKFLVGFVILQPPAIGFFFGLIVDQEPLAVIFGIVGGLLTLLITTLGFGGVILTRFGTRDYKNEKVRVMLEVVTEKPPA